MKRREAGFSFIEILVVMGIISVLVSMVVVFIPKIVEKQNQTKSKDNVHNLIMMLISRKDKGGWPPYNGKNFHLSLVATQTVDIRNVQNLEVFFSPGDTHFTLAKAGGADKYKELEGKQGKAALKAGQDFHELTSYAGRRNNGEYEITSDQESQDTIIICDDDDGPVHHSGGIIVGYTSSKCLYLEWEELDMPKPNDADHPDPFLGDQASNDMLRRLSSGS